jgi:tetratricopeptide (TPR) repeat protein
MDEGVRDETHLESEEALLYHLLSCTSCRERAQVALLERHGTNLALPGLGLGGLLDEDCDPGIPVEGLVDELLARPREQHFELLDEPPFDEGLLVGPLLRRSRQEQLREPAFAEHLAFLAARLAGRTLDDAGLRTALVRAGLLKGNARRLAGRLEEAHQALAEGSFLGSPLPDLARLRRAVGLVRWEQGRLEEAVFELEGAVQMLFAARRCAEEGESLVLLGLLEAEAGLLPQCTGSLLSGLRRLPAEARPWLAARACLTLAGAFASLGCPEEAQHLLRKGRDLIRTVDDPAEATFLYGLEGAALAALGEAEEACALLRPVRSRHLIEARLPEAALASLDLALALAEQGGTGEVESLAGELEERFPTAPAVSEAAAALRKMRWSDPALRRNVETASLALRRRFRSQGPRPRPLPFA